MKKSDVLKLKDLKLDDKNANKGTARGRAMLETSLQKYGAGRSILIDKNNMIIAGNKTTEVAESIGLNNLRIIETNGKEIIAVKRMDLDLKRDKAAKELAIADNRVGQIDLEWDDKNLADVLASGSNLDSFFHEGELNKLLGTAQNPNAGMDAEPQFDKAEELRKKYGVKPGQVWQLDSHRLICGDCGDPETIKKLFGDNRAILMNTDPPYGIAYDSTASKPDGHKRKCPWETIENDTLVNEDIQPFLERCFRCLKENALKKNAAWYLWHAHLTGAFFAAAAAAADVLLHRQIVWIKPRFIIGFGQYHWAHEPCFMGWVRGNKPPFYGERNQTTVWNIDYDGKKNPTDRIHPTQKPVQLFVAPMLNHAKKGEICCEPFSGSGSQIMAGEQTGRRIFACEVEPKYVAVSIQRWVDATGKKAKLLK